MEQVAELVGWLIIGIPVVLGLVGSIVLNLLPAPVLDKILGGRLTVNGRGWRGFVFGSEETREARQ